MATFIAYQPPGVGRSRPSSCNGSAPTARQKFKRPAAAPKLTAQTRNEAVQFRHIPAPSASKTPLSPSTGGQAPLGAYDHGDEGWNSDRDLPPLSKLICRNPKAAAALRLYHSLQSEASYNKLTDSGSIGPCASIEGGSGPLLGCSEKEPLVVDSDEESSGGEGDLQLLAGDLRTAVPAADAVVVADEDKGEDIDAFPATILASSGNDDPPLLQPPGSEVDVQIQDGSPRKEGDSRTGEEGYADPAISAHLPVLGIDSTPQHRNAAGLPPASAGHIYDVFAELHEQSIKQGAVSDNVGRRDRLRSTSPSVPSMFDGFLRNLSPPETDKPNCSIGLDGRLSIDGYLDSNGVCDCPDNGHTASADVDGQTRCVGRLARPRAPAGTPAFLERRSARCLHRSQALSPGSPDVLSPADDNVRTIQPNLRPRNRRLSLIEPANTVDTRGQRRSLRVSRPSWKKKAADEAKVIRTAIKSARASPKGRKQSQTRRRGGALPVHRERLDIEDVFIGVDGSIQCLVRPRPFLLPKEKLIGQDLHKRCNEVFTEKYGLGH